MTKKRISLFQLFIDPLTVDEVLEKIKMYLSAPPKFIHIVSINPENCVIAHQNSSFREVCRSADLALTDGVGIVLAAQLLGLSALKRVQGSILLPRLLDLAGQMSLRVVLIGSQAKIADNIAQCYSRGYPEATFIGVAGYKNALHPTPEEEGALEAIVRNTRPHFVFVAFGSPTQELWIHAHSTLLQGSICMGVGGAFDYVAGATPRPPSIISQFGLEWLYRLIIQPWRIRRQTSRLPTFLGMVLKQLFGGYNASLNEQTHPHRS